jgi:hypothetical protein
MALAQLIMSGLNPNVVVPHVLPVRPKPQITSSAISRTSYFFRTAWIFSKYVAGGGRTPPAPMIGSTIMAATVSGPSLRMRCSNEAAKRLANASSVSPGYANRYQCGRWTCRILAIGKSKSRWLFANPVRLALATVTPWYALLRLMIFFLAGRPSALL